MSRYAGPEALEGSHAEKPPETPKAERPASAEEREGRLLRRTFEYRDAEGRFQGRAIVELDDQSVEMKLRKGPAEARRLLSFVLQGERDGKPVEINVLEHINPQGDDAFVLDEHEVDNYAVYRGATPDRRTIISPMPENQADMALLLHEFGHGRQRFKESVRDLPDIKAELESVEELTGEGLASWLGEIARVMPETQEAVEAVKPYVNQFATLESRRRLLAQEGFLLKAKLEGEVAAGRLKATAEGGIDTAGISRMDNLAAAERLVFINDEIKGIDKARQYLVDEAGIDPMEIASTPHKVLEIDASGQALDWMDDFKRMGNVDLRAEAAVPASSTVTHGRGKRSDCADSAEDARHRGRAILTSAEEQLAAAATTYKAENMAQEFLINRGAETEAKP